MWIRVPSECNKNDRKGRLSLSRNKSWALYWLRTVCKKMSRRCHLGWTQAAALHRPRKMHQMLLLPGAVPLFVREDRKKSADCLGKPFVIRKKSHLETKSLGLLGRQPYQIFFWSENIIKQSGLSKPWFSKRKMTIKTLTHILTNIQIYTCTNTHMQT